MALRWRQPHPCPTCGKPTTGTRCRECHRAAQPPAQPPRVKTHAEKRRRAAFVAQWRATVGDWCPGYRRSGHHIDPDTNPITADHVVPVARGGSEAGELSALCRSCNSSKRDGRFRTTVRRSPAPPGPRRPSREWDGEQPRQIHSRTW